MKIKRTGLQGSAVFLLALTLGASLILSSCAALPKPSGIPLPGPFGGQSAEKEETSAEKEEEDAAEKEQPSAEEAAEEDRSSSGEADGENGSGSGEDAEESGENGGPASGNAAAPVQRLGLRGPNAAYEAAPGLVPSIPVMDPGPNLENVVNPNDIGLSWLSAEAVNALKTNQFYVAHQSSSDGFPEFYELYESNRYEYVPSFVTVDSLMHTYHLYFTVLMKKVEKEYAAPVLAAFSQGMLDKSRAQLAALRGTAWEGAALRNVAYFAIGANLLSPGTPVEVELQTVVDGELSKIYAADSIAPCGLFEGLHSTFYDYYEEVYTQYKPRGNYEGDPALEAYFRAMTWYGRLPFAAEDEDTTRSALLMTLAINDGLSAEWERLYQVTSFFAGVSDDCTWYDYMGAVRASYPDEASYSDIAALPGNAGSFAAFQEALKTLEPPRINALPNHAGAEQDNSGKGFRMMGQRYNVDGEIYERLTEWNEDSALSRIIPDALDVPNALGSPAAEQLMTEKGDALIPLYQKELPVLREELAKTDRALWRSSLYAGWLDTLTPLLTPRRAGWPSFMQTEGWLYKTLETYEGSYAELKHDTVLYAKQVYVAEGDGEAPKAKDDRGFVEPEPEVYARFASLAADTRDGLERFQFLDQESRTMLDGLVSLAVSLLNISEKELLNQNLTEEEYELIRNYGGIIETYWEAYKNAEYSAGLNSSTRLDASLVTDIASGDGWVLEIGTGLAQKVVAIVPVDGSLRFATGTVYSFYEFVNQGEERLTDSEWKSLNGFRPGPDSGTAQPVEKPWWTMRYRVKPWN